MDCKERYSTKEVEAMMQIPSNRLIDLIKQGIVYPYVPNECSDCGYLWDSLDISRMLVVQALMTCGYSDNKIKEWFSKFDEYFEPEMTYEAIIELKKKRNKLQEQEKDGKE